MSDVQWVVLCLVGIFVGYLSGYTDKERVKHELSFCVKQLEQNLKRKSVETANLEQENVYLFSRVRELEAKESSVPEPTQDK